MWKHLKHYLCIGFTAGLIASLLYVLGVILLAVKATSALATVESYKILYQNYFLIAGVLYLLVALYFAVSKEKAMAPQHGQHGHQHCPWTCAAVAIVTAAVTYYLLVMVIVPYLTNMLAR